MTTSVQRSAPPSRAIAANPFFYGSRFTAVTGPDGRRTFNSVPLSEADILHPRDGDHVSNSDRHHERCAYLFHVLQHHLAGEVGTRVFADLEIDWRHPTIDSVTPDVAVVRNLPARERWTSLVVPRVHARVDLIIEHTSQATARNDRKKKLGYYALFGVPWYVLIDDVRGANYVPPRLRVRKLVDGVYEEQAPDEKGRYWLEPVGLWLTVVNEDVELQDAQGNRLAGYDETVQQLATSKAERDAAVAAQLALAQRVRELEAQLHGSRARQDEG